MALLAAIRSRSISFDWVREGTPRRSSKEKPKPDSPGGLQNVAGTPSRKHSSGDDASGAQEGREDCAVCSAEREASAHGSPDDNNVLQQTPTADWLVPPPNAFADVRELTTPPPKGSRSCSASPWSLGEHHESPGLQQDEDTGIDPGSAGAGPAATGGRKLLAKPRCAAPTLPSPGDFSRSSSKGQDGAEDLVRGPEGYTQVPDTPMDAAPLCPARSSPTDADVHPEQQAPGFPPELAVPPQAPVALLQPRIRLYLGSDTLGLMIAPGDVLVVRGSGGLSRIGAAGGLMGHVMVVVAAPRSVLRSSPDAEQVEEAWPGPEVPELWRVPTVESTTRETGLWEAEMILFIDRRTRRLKLAGEVDGKGELTLADVETVELWQSPEPLRSDLRVNLMHEVLSDMRQTQANWSARTAARAVLRSAEWTSDKRRDAAKTMSEIKASWESAPICTSVVISFWQRYLHRIATSPSVGGATHFSAGERVAYFSQSMQEWIDAVVVTAYRDAHGAVLFYDLDIKVGAMPGHIRREEFLGRKAGDAHAVELIMKYMPIKADRGLPGDLTKAMGDSGWISVMQVPLLFSQEMVQVPTYL